MRLPSIVLVALSLLVAQAAPAHAWSNGTDGYNSYGTHDWVLDHALGALSHRADWVRAAGMCLLSSAGQPGASANAEAPGSAS